MPKNVNQIALECKLPTSKVYYAIKQNHVSGFLMDGQRKNMMFYDKYSEDLIHSILGVEYVYYESKINAK